MKKKAGVLILLMLILAFTVFALFWIKHRIDYAVTDAVFVKADELASVGFQVSGRVIKIYKDLGDRVKAGELIAELDPEDYKLQVESLQAKIESLRSRREQLLSQLSRISRELQLNYSMAKLSAQEVKAREEALKRQIKEVEVQLELAAKDKERFKNLLEQKLIPARRFEEVDVRYRTLLEKKRAFGKKLEELRSAYKKALKSIEKAKVSLEKMKEIEKEIEALSKDIESLEKQKELAEKNLDYTKLVAPFDGVVAKRFISTGDIVKAGQPAFALVKESSIYVEVLLEETKLKGVKVGSKAYVRLDAYPDKVFEGAVEKISPASAATFALIPRDVSAGEFTKVVQRIPIKIKITKGDLSLLRVGMGGEVEIKRER